MRGDLKVRKVRTGSGTMAVQIVQYADGKRVAIRYLGSARTDDELTALWNKAEHVREQLCIQPSIFSQTTPSSRLLHKDHSHLKTVTHQFAHEVLKKCSQLCGLGALNDLYQDLAVMRIIEPTSKLRTLELLERYFNIAYAERSVYRLLPKLIKEKSKIEQAAYTTASTYFGESFALVLYDVTTLYFESHEPDDDLLAHGFSKDDKSKQPQIVIG